MSHAVAGRRRRLLRLLGIGVMGAFIPAPVRAALRGTRHGAPHPDPRLGYKPDRVLTAEQLGGDEELIALFDGVRKIPHIVDGIRCSCGCADLPGYYSLLTCFEHDNAMSRWCPICIGTGSLVVRLHGRGRTLAQIREAVDARY